MANAGKAAAKDETAKKRCFVIGPIGGSGTPIRTHADWLLDGIIQPVFKSDFPDYDVIRSDKITIPGMIDAQMINLLLEAEVVIADMSLLNANAFYEMGIRHMAQKPIIHMFLSGSDIPFDVKPYRAIEFSIEQHRHLAAAQSELSNAMKSVTSADYQPDNPVVRARGQINLEKNATPEDLVVLQKLEAISDRISNLEFGNARFGNKNSQSNVVTSVNFVIFCPFDVKIARTESRQELIAVKLMKMLAEEGFSSSISHQEDGYLVNLGSNISKARWKNIAFNISGITGLEFPRLIHGEYAI